MRIFIAGMDGYLGWSLAKHLTSVGHDVFGVDLFLRRKWVEEMRSVSALPIWPIEVRLEEARNLFGRSLQFQTGDLCDFDSVERAFREFQPEAVVQLGECPSAPYSMIDRQHAVFVQTNNVVGTFNLLFAMKTICPSAHLIKLGTMGEYGTPDIDIPEGFFDVEFRGRRDRLPFPRTAGSWYHWSKVHSSNNIMFACKQYGLRATDIMQGVVVGSRWSERAEDERLATRLDFDEAFGTIVNRFCCQAVIGHPLTQYGAGKQTRGFLALRDTMQCLTLVIEHPPAAGEYRVFNQFAEIHSVAGLAEIVRKASARLGIDVAVCKTENPRIEREQHYYNPDCIHLRDLGYRPTHSLEQEVAVMLTDLMPHRERIRAKQQVLLPTIRWGGGQERVQVYQASESHPPLEWAEPQHQGTLQESHPLRARSTGME